MNRFKRPVRCLSMFLLLSLCFGIFATSVRADSVGSFSDVADDAPYLDAVETLAELGVLTGYGDGTFRPDATITRAEAAAVICRMLGMEAEAKEMTDVVFSDVPTTHWAVGYVAMAAEQGIINGFGDGTFKPSEPVTQEQMIKMLVCAWGYGERGEELGGWPKGYLTVADELGITSKLLISSSNEASRAIVAQLAFNTLSVDYFDDQAGYEVDDW